MLYNIYRVTQKMIHSVSQLKSVRFYFFRGVSEPEFRAQSTDFPRTSPRNPPDISQTPPRHPPDDYISTSCKVGFLMALLALVSNLATRWHYMHNLQSWPPDGTTCTSYKFDHQMAPIALVTNLATRWRHMHVLISR